MSCALFLFENTSATITKGSFLAMALWRGGFNFLFVGYKLNIISKPCLCQFIYTERSSCLSAAEKKEKLSREIRYHLTCFFKPFLLMQEWQRLIMLSLARDMTE
jgi:hypothetical protein